MPALCSALQTQFCPWRPCCPAYLITTNLDPKIAMSIEVDVFTNQQAIDQLKEDRICAERQFLFWPALGPFLQRDPASPLAVSAPGLWRKGGVTLLCSQVRNGQDSWYRDVLNSQSWRVLPSC